MPPEDDPTLEEPDEAPLTPGERLFYALGQLYRRWHACELPVHPYDFDVVELATTIGVKRDIERVVEHRHAYAIHFRSEVLVVLDEDFPWVLLDEGAWQAWCELDDDLTAWGDQPEKGEQ